MIPKIAICLEHNICKECNGTINDEGYTYHCTGTCQLPRGDLDYTEELDFNKDTIIPELPDDEIPLPPFRTIGYVNIILENTDNESF